MSLDNTPPVRHCADTVDARHTHGRPEHELVPSRYALRVGKIEVLVVSDGVLSLQGAMLGHNADPAVRALGLVAVALTFPPRGVVIERRRGFILLAVYVVYVVVVLLGLAS